MEKESFIIFRGHRGHRGEEVEKEENLQKEKNIDNFFIRCRDEKEKEKQEGQGVFVRIARRVPKLSKKNISEEKVVQEAWLIHIVTGCTKETQEDGSLHHSGAVVHKFRG